MNKLEIEELIDAVENINKNLSRQLQKSDGDIYTGWSYVTIKILRDSYRVGIAGVNIWFSDNDEREWIEKVREEHKNGSGNWRMIPGHYELIEPYLRKKINKITAKIATIKL